MRDGPDVVAVDMDESSARDAYEGLKGHLAGLGGVLLAYSGGVDSSLLLAAARDALGKARILAVTACSATYPDHEREAAVALAKALDVRHRLIETDELANAVFRSNPPDRCYHCKRELFRVLAEMAATEGLRLIDGANADDEADFRPGRRAAVEFGVCSPLVDLRLGKVAIRAMARMRGLPNWSQPACACLASRLPYGEEITAERLARVAAAEAAIRALGFVVVRVRDHGALARIELGAVEIGRALDADVRQRLDAACRAHGFTYVCLDLNGYRTGAMNETLVPQVRDQALRLRDDREG